MLITRQYVYLGDESSHQPFVYDRLIVIHFMISLHIFLQIIYLLLALSCHLTQLSNFEYKKHANNRHRHHHQIVIFFAETRKMKNHNPKPHIKPPTQPYVVW